MKNKVGIREEVDTYFANKAAKYDLVDTQVYWRLSDTILWDLLKEKVINNFSVSEGFTFLDAGGGTGRWAFKILNSYKESHGYIIDVSDEMLDEARKKIDAELAGRIKITKGNLNELEVKDDYNFDLTFNFHNVLGFVEDPYKVLNNLSKVTKKGGYVVSLVPNLYHTMFFNIKQGIIEDLSDMYDNNVGRFTKDMPYINLFTPSSLVELYQKCDLKVELISGFPSLIYPGYQETRLVGSSEPLQNILESEANFQQLVKIEKLILSSETASRGNNLFIIGKK